MLELGDVGWGVCIFSLPNFFMLFIFALLRVLSESSYEIIIYIYGWLVGGLRRLILTVCS